MGVVQEFKKFAMRGNVVDMAVGVVIGAAFGKIVSSLVEKIIMPVTGYLTGGVDFSSASVELRAADGEQEAVVVGYGVFIQSIIDFVIIAVAIFIVIKLINKAKEQFDQEEEEKAPKAPPEDIQLLREIRDALQKT